MKPTRVQRRRTLGWRKPPDTRIVDRSTAFGNPFRADAHTPEAHAVVVGLFRRWLAGEDFPEADGATPERRAALLARLGELRGLNLACTCAPELPCHADVLLEIANP